MLADKVTFTRVIQTWWWPKTSRWSLGGYVHLLYLFILSVRVIYIYIYILLLHLFYRLSWIVHWQHGEVSQHFHCAMWSVFNKGKCCNTAFVARQHKTTTLRISAKWEHSKILTFYTSHKHSCICYVSFHVVIIH